MSNFKTIDSERVQGKRVLVRVDLNVPMKNGKVTDATRIERAAPTLKELADKGAKVVVLSHFGRPDGKRVPEMSLKPLIEPLSKALGKPVAFADDCVGPQAEAAVKALQPGDVLLLENLRFHKEEEKNDKGFVDQLAALGDIYVNDAFSAAHRAHASTEAIARLLPAAAGKLMQAELEALGAALETPQRIRPEAGVLPDPRPDTRLGQFQDHRRHPADRQRDRIGVDAPGHGVRPEETWISRRVQIVDSAPRNRSGAARANRDEGIERCHPRNLGPSPPARKLSKPIAPPPTHPLG